MRLLWIIAVVFFSTVLLRTATAELAGKVLFDVKDAAMLQHVEPTTKRVTAKINNGLNVTIIPGEESYPGIAIKPADGKPWDLSASGDVQATVINTGKTSIDISMRIDNEGPWQQEPWNAESISLQPGTTGAIKVIFGYSYGHKPSYALKAGAIADILFFTGKSKDEQSFAIESIAAGGSASEKPPIDPQSIRIAPTAGYIFGKAVAPEQTERLISTGQAKEGVLINSTAEAIEVPPAGRSAAVIELRPKLGKWNLNLCNEARVVLRNTGTVPVSPSVCLESDGGLTDTIAATSPIGPGAETEIIIPFAPAVVWRGISESVDRSSWEGQKDTGTRFASDAVKAVRLILPPSETAQSIVVKSVQVDAPPAVLPAWLGERPPVEGDWVKTFDDEFDGKELDASKWNVVGKNYYDKQSRFVKENVIVGGGIARLRYEKRPGAWASKDDGDVTQYATGFLDTFGKWTQRYGYFESRLKLPRSPGLWPAFWMMPDRGAASRDPGNTGDNGMEFDIMEHLTGWGPFRYNIAMHWDGYGKDHKATGSENIYVQADKDGYITTGLLWTPGSAVYYCNGREVLRWKNARISSVPSDLMFTLPMGGWENTALDDSKLPADFVIDYVRCWQRKDLGQ